MNIEIDIEPRCPDCGNANFSFEAKVNLEVCADIIVCADLELEPDDKARCGNCGKVRPLVALLSPEDIRKMCWEDELAEYLHVCTQRGEKP